MSVDSSSPTLQHEGYFTQHHPPSSEGDYLTPQRINQDPHDSLCQHTTPPKKDMENLKNQLPDVMISKAFFNFQDNKYHLLHNRETVNPMSATYHKCRDQCFYYSFNGQRKSATIVDVPNHAWYMLYRLGKLEIPDWPQLGCYLMTLTASSPLPPSPHVSFPQLAFRPVIPAQDTYTD